MTDMETTDSGTRKTQTHEEARQLRDDAWERSRRVYKDAKEQADIVYEAAKKLAADKESRKRAEEAHEEALVEARKLRDAITRTAESVFSDFWRK
jgi:hypothetical protein